MPDVVNDRATKEIAATRIEAARARCFPGAAVESALVVVAIIIVDGNVFHRFDELTQVHRH